MLYICIDIYISTSIYISFPPDPGLSKPSKIQLSPAELRAQNSISGIHCEPNEKPAVGRQAAF